MTQRYRRSAAAASFERPWSARLSLEINEVPPPHGQPWIARSRPASYFSTSRGLAARRWTGRARPRGEMRPRRSPSRPSAGNWPAVTASIREAIRGSCGAAPRSIVRRRKSYPVRGRALSSIFCRVRYAIPAVGVLNPSGSPGLHFTRGIATIVPAHVENRCWAR